jgi:hypothetical protein
LAKGSDSQSLFDAAGSRDDRWPIAAQSRQLVDQALRQAGRFGMRLRPRGGSFTAAGDALRIGDRRLLPDRTRAGIARLGFRLIVQRLILVLILVPFRV